MLKMKRNYLVISLVVLSLLFLGGCGGQGNNDQAKNEQTDQAKKQTDTYTLKFAASWAKGDNAQFKSLEVFKDVVEKETNGRLKIQIMGGAEVFPPTETAEAVKNGAIDGAYTSAAYYSGMIPEGNALSVTNMTNKEMVASGGMSLLREIHAKNNLFFLMVMDEVQYQPFAFVLTKPIEKVEDMKGKRLRAAPGIYSEVIKAVGATPVTMPMSDLFSALEQGLVDGYTTVTISGGKEGYFKYAQNMVRPGWYRGASGVIINLDSWNKLPKDLQEQLDGITEKIGAEWDKLNKSELDKNLELLKAAGGKENQLPQAEADKLTKLVSDIGWAYVKQKAPQYGADLEKKLSK